MNKPMPGPQAGALETRVTGLGAVTSRDLLFIIRKWAWEFLAIVAAVIAATLLYIALFRDPLYESETRLFVRLSQEQQPPRTLLAPQGATVITAGTSDVTSEMDLFLNADLARRVIEETGLEAMVTAPAPAPESLTDWLKYGLRSVTGVLTGGVDQVAYALGMKVPVSLNEALVRRLRQSLTIQNTRTSNVIVASFRWPEREVPQFLLQHYLDAYMRFRFAVFDEGDERYFERRRDETAARLAEVEAGIAALRESAGIEDLDAQRKILLPDLMGLEAAERESALRLAIATERLTAVSGRGGPGDSIVLANLPGYPLLQSLDEQSVAAASEWLRVSALPRLDGGNLQALAGNYAALTAATARALSDTMAQLRAERDSARARMEVIRARLAAMAADEARWNQLQIDKKLAVTDVEQSAQNLAEAVNARELRRERLGNIVVIQQPTEVTLASGTRNMTIVVLGVVFAIFAAGSWVTIREFLDGRVWRPSDLAGRDVPLLGTGQKQDLPPTPASFAPAGAALYPLIRNRSMATIMFMALGEEPSNAAARTRALAAALLEQGAGSVRIVNAGRWRPEDAPGPGPAGVTEIIVPPDIAQVDTHIASSPALREDGGRPVITIVAAPPLFSSALSLHLAQAGSGVVLDVTAGRTEATDVTDAVNWVRQNGGRVLGLLLADVPRFATGGLLAR